MGGHEGYEARNEVSDESNETSYEGHEGQESHEGEQDRKGKAGPCSRVRRWQREDQQWHDQGPAGEEQDWQDCEQEGVCSGQEGLRDEPAEEVDGAMKQARKQLNIKGFCACGGKTAQGKALYAKTKSILSAK